jgi:hypothetical protein
MTIRANPRLQLEPVRVRQHHVEHHQIRRQIAHCRQRTCTVRSRSNLEPLVPQSGRNELGDIRLIVHHQHPAALAPRNCHGPII